MSDTSAIDATPPAWLPTWLERTWDLLASYPLLLPLAIVVIGLLLAVLTRAVILFWGLKVTSRTRAATAEGLVRLLAGVTALAVAYLSLTAAVAAMPLPERVATILIRVLVTLLVLQLMRAGLKAAHLGLTVLSKLRDRFPIVEERTIPLFDIMATVFIVAIAAYALLQVWRIDATAWLASAGVVGLAVGFAARETLANLFAGFFIIADAPYKVGDYIVLDSGERGEVTQVGIRSTRLLTRDDVEITVPNAEMANTKIMNESGGRWVKFRARLKVGVAYGSDVDQVVELLERTAREHETISQDPAPRVRMRGFGDSSLEFELLCWLNHPSERGRVTHELYMAVYKALGRAGIEIPFPQRDVWVRQIPELPVPFAEGSTASQAGFRPASGT